LFKTGLKFCKYKLAFHDSNRTYVYHHFIEDIVTLEHREEFVNRLENIDDPNFPNGQDVVTDDEFD